MLEIIGTEGILVVLGAKNFKVFLQSKHVSGHEQLTLVETEQLPKDEEIPSAQFVRFLESKHPQDLQEYSINDAINLTRLIECAYESARDAKTVLY